MQARFTAALLCLPACFASSDPDNGGSLFYISNVLLLGRE